MTFQKQSPDQVWDALLNTAESKAFLEQEVLKAMKYLNSQRDKLKHPIGCFIFWHLVLSSVISDG
ncbi:hypothetical protein [Burkholderia cenocepacia]|nr:hypothetical protein [Burkholderia cenocepacia]